MQVSGRTAVILALLQLVGVPWCSIPATNAMTSWGPWTTWSPCSVSCGGGSRTRMRTCLHAPCYGSSVEKAHCNFELCEPIVCEEDAKPADPAWKLSTLDIDTDKYSTIKVGTVEVPGDKLKLLWLFGNLNDSQIVSIFSPPCNRLWAVAKEAQGSSWLDMHMDKECKYKMPVAEHVSTKLTEATCDISSFTPFVAADCSSDVRLLTFYSPKASSAVLVNVDIAGSTSFITGLVQNNGTMWALPGTPWRAVSVEENSQRLLINGECNYTTTMEQHQWVLVGPMYGGWGEWGPWENCTSMAGGAQARRRRPCDNPPPRNDGRCPGTQYLVAPCDCSQPTIPAHSYGVDLLTSYNRGAQVHVVCDPGYLSTLTNRDSYYIYCNSNNRWQNYQTCGRHECPAVTVSNGVVSGGAAPFYLTSSVTVTCNHGYATPVGTFSYSVVCHPRGWQPVVHKCEPTVPDTVQTPCSSPPTVAHATTSGGPGAVYVRGSQVSVVCHSGFILQPSPSQTRTAMLTCRTDFHWQPDVQCVVARCPVAIDYAGNHIDPVPDLATHASFVTLTCASGYLSHGLKSFVAYCTADGSWSNLDSCQAEFPFLVEGLVIGAVALVLLVLLIVLLCCCCLWKPAFIPPTVSSFSATRLPQPPLPRPRPTIYVNFRRAFRPIRRFLQNPVYNN